MQYFWKEYSIRVLGFFSQAMDTNSASFDAHVQVKTTMSQLPPGNSKFKIHSDFRGVKMLKNLKKKRKKGRKERRKKKEERENGRGLSEVWHVIWHLFLTFLLCLMYDCICVYVLGNCRQPSSPGPLRKNICKTRELMRPTFSGRQIWETEKVWMSFAPGFCHT